MSKRIFSGILLSFLLIGMLTSAFNIQPIKATAAQVYFSVEPAAVPPLTDINESINGLETPPTPSPVGQTFTVNIKLYNVTTSDVPLGLAGVEVYLTWNNTLIEPLSFVNDLGKSGGVLVGTILYAINPGFFDAEGNSIATAPYTNATQFEVCAASTTAWWGDGAEVASITFQITGQPSSPQPDFYAPLQLTFVDLADESGNSVSSYVVQGTLHIDAGAAQVSQPYFSVEPVAVPPLTDINGSINGLETPPMPSPVGQNFTVEIHLRNATSTNVPTGVSGLEVHFYFGNILNYCRPLGFTDILGEPGGVLLGSSILYGLGPGFFDASGNQVSSPPYAGAVYFEIAAASTNGSWNGADGLVATISFQITKQPQGQNGEPTVTLPLINDFTVLVDSTASSINHDSVQGTLSIDTTTAVSPPVASFSYSPLMSIPGESITLDASSSSPGWNGTQTMPIVSYAWDFGDNNKATGQVVTHAYADSGNYTVTLNVTDSEGLWLAEQRQIQVIQPNGPVAEFTTSPRTGLVGEAMDFNASSSTEGWNGTNAVPITEYLWDFGDGNVTSSVDSTIVHSYAYAGSFNVTLTAFDSENMSSSCSNTVLVIMPTSISVSTSVTSSLIGYTVGINGTLSDIYGNGIGNEPVVLYYAFPTLAVFITSTTTDDNGQYSAQWIPTATGTFCIVAEWTGNTTYSAASSNVTMSCIATTNENVFSVESNSTITGLAFNTTSQELSFTASGPSGTMGYAKVTIAKSLVSNIANIRVYLDNNQIEYSIASTDDSWLLTFNYTHSTHTVRVDLSASVIPEFSNDLFVFLLATLAVAALIVEKRKLAKLNSNSDARAHMTIRIEK